jgi:signal transduction histidine kinase/ligand-binding sensor domain-containing protein
LGICVWLFALALAAPAQAQYRFDSWTADTGLPQNTVSDIYQTRDGYLWLSTMDGLLRFDGVRFTVFDKGNSQGISSNRVLRLYEDAQGDLWAGTEDGGVIRYHEGRFISYGKEQGLTSLYAAYLTDDTKGNLFVYLVNDQVMRLADGKFVPLGQTNPVSSPILSKPTALQESRRVPCPNNSEHIFCLGYGATGWTEADGLPSLHMVGNNAIEDRHGALWMVLDTGLVKIENGTVARVYTERDGLPGSPILFVTGARTSFISKDRQGAVWLTDLETMRSQFVGGNVPTPITAPGNAVGYEDREGNLWFGTTREGLFRARKQFITAYSTPDGLAQNNIYPIYEDREGVIWVGTTKGLFRYKDGVFTLDESLKDNLITAIAEDQSGRLIVASYGKVWVREGKRFDLLMEKKGGVIWAIYPDQDGTLWFGWELGLIRFKDGAEVVYKTEDGLSGNDVKVIISDANGGLWIGTYGGLTHYASGRFNSWTERDGLPSRTVRSLYRDDEGVLWIGTYDGGLGRFKDGKFTRYTTGEGLFNNGVFQILEDGQGLFWLSSNRGIYRVSRRELEEFADGRRASITSVAYGKSDGMLNVECNGGRWPAGIRAHDNRLWFPTQDGVAVIDPESVPFNPQPPPVRVESFLVDRAPAAFDREIQVQPDQENFEINYTALSYINSENLRFKYRLEGLDSDWIDAGVRRTAYYSHVPPGAYTFHVIAANSDGVWNMDGASVRVTVRPRLYQTWWFRTAVALGIFGLGFAAYRVRVNRLEWAHKAQEEFSHKLLASQEQERQRISSELHDSLGQSLLIIKNRIALAQSEIDERETVEEQLDELSHSATAAIEECREIAYNLRPYQISRFGLAKTLYGIFMRINEVTDIKATAEIDEIDDLLTDEAQINVYRIVQECVNNIIKHSLATEASLSVKRDRGDITFLIQDNGRGFVKGELPTEGNGRGGFGLIGIAERIKMLPGQFEIDSEHGTRIRIRIPLTFK